MAPRRVEPTRVALGGAIGVAALAVVGLLAGGTLNRGAAGSARAAANVPTASATLQPARGPAAVGADLRRTTQPSASPTLRAPAVVASSTTPAPPTADRTSSAEPAASPTYGSRSTPSSPPKPTPTTHDVGGPWAIFTVSISGDPTVKAGQPYAVTITLHVTSPGEIGSRLCGPYFGVPQGCPLGSTEYYAPIGTTTTTWTTSYATPGTYTITACVYRTDHFEPPGSPTNPQLQVVVT